MNRQGEYQVPGQSRHLREAIEAIARRGFSPEEQKKWNAHLENRKKQAERDAAWESHEE